MSLRGRGARRLLAGLQAALGSSSSTTAAVEPAGTRALAAASGLWQGIAARSSGVAPPSRALSAGAAGGAGASLWRRKLGTAPFGSAASRAVLPRQGGAARIANPPVGLRMLTGLGGPPLGSVLPQRDPQTIPRLAAGELKEQSSADDSCASDTQPDGASSEQLFQTWLEELHRQGVTVEVVLKEGSGASIKMGDGRDARRLLAGLQAVLGSSSATAAVEPAGTRALAAASGLRQGTAGRSFGLAPPSRALSAGAAGGAGASLWRRQLGVASFGSAASRVLLPRQGATPQGSNLPLDLRLLASLGRRPLGTVLLQRGLHASPPLAADREQSGEQSGEQTEQSSAGSRGASDTQPDGASPEQLFQAWLEEVRQKGAEVVIEKEGGEIIINRGDGFLWGTFGVAKALGGEGMVAALVAFYSYYMMARCAAAARKRRLSRAPES